MPGESYISVDDISEVAPEIACIIDREAERQARKLIMIPSESYAPRAVRQALGSVFQNIYAEGYPPLRMTRDDEDLLLDYAHQLEYYRRYGDRRFYKGVDYVHFVETLAQRRAAEIFATGEIPANFIHVNVQALSGSPANLAVYDTLMEPGDVLMGMDLYQGGHLTHGSEFNISGRRYRVASYGVSPETGRLDYAEIMRLALGHRPKVIIGGFTSYPWAPDWIRFREIADAVGAYLLADISHTAGLVAAGAHPSPMGIADVITFTTHKTMCGPRGAVTMTTDEDLGLRLDLAVFPGAQGGPHTNKFAAMAVAFKLANTAKFRELQHQIVRNARALGDGLESRGLKLAYGGTNTHLLLLDVGAIPNTTGYPLRGEMAVRILDLAGIVANKNTIPGDDVTALATGVRLGTPWVTQRGLKEGDMDYLAGLINDIVSNIKPFQYTGLAGILPRGKIDVDILSRVERDVAALTDKAYAEYDGEYTGYPHFCIPPSGDIRSLDDPPVVYEVSGWRADHFVQEISTGNLRQLAADQAIRTFLLNGKGELIDEVGIQRLSPDQRGRSRFLIATHPERAAAVGEWLRGLARGYILFDREDLFRKVQGPAVVEEASAPRLADTFTQEPGIRFSGRPPSAARLYRDHPERFDLTQPYFVGMADLQKESPSGGEKESWIWAEPNLPVRRTRLNQVHRELGARMVPFAGWEMPVRYATSVMEEHQAVREAAGLFDVAHMGVFEISGPHATSFLDIVNSNYIAWLDPGQSCYSYLLDPSGAVIDDIMVYCRTRDRYLMVVNAANAEKDWDWLNAVNERRVVIDRNRPWVQVDGRATIRDLKDPASGPDQKVDIAFQGPAALPTLQDMADDPAIKRSLKQLRRTDLVEVELGGIPLVIARTGYTGEEIGYEIFVHPDRVVELWNLILRTGAPYGVKPAGLAARDSTRTEFGLPLYGHELAGEYRIDPIEAGFAGYVKYHKPFFVGRDEMLAKEGKRSMQVLRFRMDEKGVRVPKSGDPVANRRGQIVGNVTSCSLDRDGFLTGLAYCNSNVNIPGASLEILTLPNRVPPGKAADELEPGDRVVLADAATVLTRFIVREDGSGPLPGGQD